MWKLIGKILGSIAVISTSGVILWQVFVFMDTTQDQAQYVNTTLQRVVKADSIQNVKVDSVIENINALSRDVTNLTTSNDNLRLYMMNHATDKGDLLEVLEIWESKKKSQSNLGETVSRQ